MEEILASIRRIIEDSDTIRTPGEADEPAAAANDVVAPLTQASPEFEPAVEVEEEVEAFRAEFDVEPAVTAAPAPSTMAEIQAAVMRERASPPEPVVAGFTAHRAEQETFEAEAPVAVAGFDESDEVLSAPAASHWHPVEAGEPVQQQAPVPLSEASVETLVPRAAEGRPAMLSVQTERQVAAAFGELSEAFAASRQRSFDDMAQEMLRPMLQDWLDNNLPGLVEKLVREEIERVARGGKG